MTNSCTDIKNADLIIVMGGNAAEAHPVGFKWVVEAMQKRKARLISVDPRFNRTSALADTLERFVALGLDRRGAAADLGVHPNTLDYRLRRIGELTGLDLGQPRDVAIVVLACRQRRLMASGL